MSNPLADMEKPDVIFCIGTNMTECHPVAATLLGEIGDITRFPTPAAFAAWSGTAPLDASSGRHQRHRLNRRGNRQVNRVLDTAILTQLAHHGPAHTYIKRRLQEGKTKKEATRAAKRHLATHIYRKLNHHQNLT